MRPASHKRGFSTATFAMFGHKQTLMLRLLTANNNAWWSVFGRALLVTVQLGLTCYPDNLVHRFIVCFWRKGTGIAEGNSVISQEKHWFQHDNAAAHFACQVWEHLTATYNGNWIGRGRPMAWPSRSPDLTPKDFFLWGHIKALIYMLPVDSEEDLIARIVEVAAWHF